MILPVCTKCRWWLVYSCGCVPNHCRRLADPGDAMCKFEPKRNPK